MVANISESWHNERIECKSTKDAPWWDEANNCGASKPIWSTWMDFLDDLYISQHQNVTPTIEIEPSLSQNCCWCQLQKFTVMHLSSRPSAVLYTQVSPDIVDPRQKLAYLSQLFWEANFEYFRLSIVRDDKND